MCTPGDVPDSISLGHELIHAQRNLHGQFKGANGSVVLTHNRGGQETSEKVSREEAETVGLVRGAPGMATENKLRRDQGLPERAAYSPPDTHVADPNVWPVGEPHIPQGQNTSPDVQKK